MAKKQKKNSKKPNSKTNQKTKKKGGSNLLKITAVLAALIHIPTIALTGLILYAGTTGTGWHKKCCMTFCLRTSNFCDL